MVDQQTRGLRYRLFFCVLLRLFGTALWAQRAGAETLPLTSIRDLLEAHRAQEHVLLRGTVTYTGRSIMIQDQTGAIAVESPAPVSLALGDQVEVQGSLVLHNGLPGVVNATIRNLWTGSTPLPLAITPDEAAEGAYDGMLVATEGELVRAGSTPNGGLRLTLGSGDQLFSCVMEAGSAPASMSLTPGEVVRCTGVLSVNQTERAFESGTFLVLLRSASDLHLLRPAPWWTTRHLTLCLLGLLPLALVAYLLHLRSLRLRMSLIVEERSRMAREIHDTLAQGFSGIALQLQAIDRTMGEQSAATQDHLSMALQMVRRSRAEAHRSIATLRTLHSNEELAAMLEKLLRQLTAPAGIALQVVEKGTPVRLCDELCSQIVRISQEAVANTVEHAQAGVIRVLLQHSPGRVVLTLEDDGRGFDTGAAPSVEAGHFGIAGMQERAAQIQATLAVASDEAGTRLCLDVPVLPQRPTARKGVVPWPARRVQRRFDRREVNR